VRNLASVHSGPLELAFAFPWGRVVAETERGREIIMTEFVPDPDIWSATH
jgi:hypothetical protein